MYRIRFTGNHYDIGLKFGQQLKKKNINFNKIINLTEFQQDFGKKSQIVLLEVFPEVCDEILGMTDGLNFSYEKFASWLLCMGCCYDPNGCTAFCFTKNNKVIYGRNNDLPPFLKKVSKSISYKLKNGYSFIGNTSSMIHFEEGLNEHGLAVAMTFLVPAIVTPGINSLFLVRYLLEKCTNAEEAVNILKDMPIASACNIILADKKSQIVVAECIPGKIFIRKPIEDEGFIVAANHFISEEMRHNNLKLIYSSDIRYQTAYNALKNIYYIDGIGHAKAILSGKYGFMCQYSKKLNFETIWSSVFNVTNLEIYRAEGSPLKVKYIEDKRLH